MRPFLSFQPGLSYRDRRIPWQEIRENKPISLHDFARGDRYFFTEHRARACECVELPVFTARINPMRQSRN